MWKVSWHVICGLISIKVFHDTHILFGKISLVRMWLNWSLSHSLHSGLNQWPLSYFRRKLGLKLSAHCKHSKVVSTVCTILSSNGLWQIMALPIFIFMWFSPVFSHADQDNWNHHVLQHFVHSTAFLHWDFFQIYGNIDENWKFYHIAQFTGSLLSLCLLVKT